MVWKAPIALPAATLLSDDPSEEPCRGRRAWAQNPFVYC